MRIQRNSCVPLSGLKEETLAEVLVPCFLRLLEAQFLSNDIPGMKLFTYALMVGSKCQRRRNRLQNHEAWTGGEAF